MKKKWQENVIRKILASNDFYEDSKENNLLLREVITRFTLNKKNSSLTIATKKSLANYNSFAAHFYKLSIKFIKTTSENLYLV